MTDKELIKQDKEPKCIYNRTLEERKKFCKYCSAACSVRIEEEPASKDLEKEIDEEIDNLCELGCYMEDLAKGNSEGIYPLPDNVVKELRKFARHFVEWQKQKDFKELLKSDMTQFKKCYEKGKADAMKEMKETLQTEYEKGRSDMREEMMKDAVELTITNTSFIPLPKLDIKAGDKAKIIIIKT